MNDQARASTAGTGEGKQLGELAPIFAGASR
eukprot:CAMPEP_0171123206 /NCGR_PEP_ID=MMETSP0766_2-20121228/106644_1 /TAXON_ID=439317 /ORGANISM="Gambierdiscus australes, Strain CAWD 149" /LENGTH=30 /DNA_ID= /DNA_START= /DNA_END= /DNA_ORIENTATION=